MKPDRIIPLWANGIAPYSEFSPDQAQPSVTEYAVDGAKSAMVICPGGGYSCKVDHEKEPIADIYTRAGISCYVLDYRVFPCHYEAPLSDALRAIRVVRAMGYEKVAIIGFSAGGHVCCSAATLFDAGNPDSPDPIERLSGRPDAFIASYPVVSFEIFRHEGSLENLLGKHREDQALLRRFSAELNVTEQTPPGFIWHSCGDDCVPVLNSMALATAMAMKNRPFVLHVFPDGCHGAGVASPDPNAEKWASMSVDWLRGLGFLPA